MACILWQFFEYIPPLSPPGAVITTPASIVHESALCRLLRMDVREGETYPNAAGNHADGVVVGPLGLAGRSVRPVGPYRGGALLRQLPHNFLQMEQAADQVQKSCTLCACRSSTAL